MRYLSRHDREKEETQLLRSLGCGHFSGVFRDPVRQAAQASSVHLPLHRPTPQIVRKRSRYLRPSPVAALLHEGPLQVPRQVPPRVPSGHRERAVAYEPCYLPQPLRGRRRPSRRALEADRSLSEVPQPRAQTQPTDALARSPVDIGARDRGSSARPGRNLSLGTAPRSLSLIHI